MNKRLAILLIVIFQPGVQAQTCACGPTYCVEVPAYAAALKAKKAGAESAGMPKRLSALYDRLDHCEAAVVSAPDAANILRQAKDGTITIDGWDATNEKNDAKAVKSGELSACYVILSRRAFACCNGASYEKRPDYNSTLDLNTKAAIACSE